jgi:hypothetical protein
MCPHTAVNVSSYYYICVKGPKAQALTRQGEAKGAVGAAEGAGGEGGAVEKSGGGGGGLGGGGSKKGSDAGRKGDQVRHIYSSMQPGTKISAAWY